MESNSAPGFGRRSFLSGIFAAAAASGVALGEDTKPAPAPKIHANALVYQFKIGEFDAWSISDGHMLFRGIDLMWPPEAHPEMTDWLAGHGERMDGIPLYVNILVVRIGKEIVLFDAGFGERDSANIGWLQDGLRQAGITPEQVTAGFLSHSHADHLAGFVMGGKPAFPNAAFYYLPEEYDFWHAAEPDFSKTKRNRAELPGMIKEVRNQFEILKGVSQPVKAGSQFFNGAVTIEAAPGHTAGHAIFRIKSGNESLLHFVDLSHHHGFMFHNPNWFIAFDHDPMLGIETRKRVFAQAAAERTRCYGFHVPWPGIGHVLPVGEGYLWHPERWSWGS
ncbi:MAG: MBL fold metallo-hydrolase [Luteolibacter sp.]|uniref:MBL fold metallo-hydrolase n=1 Tax=Luteolibacter sp. TaxID=1962973 RepID=UPI003262FE98